MSLEISAHRLPFTRVRLQGGACIHPAELSELLQVLPGIALMSVFNGFLSN